MINASLDRCFSFVHSQTAPVAKSAAPANVRRAVTISRQAGCGAVHVAEKLANFLQQHAPQPGVSVRDHGPGVPPHLRERIFERFYRVDASRSRELGGSGIGLTIARALAEAHGGSLWAESEGPGKGARFHLRLLAA